MIFHRIHWLTLMLLALASTCPGCSTVVRENIVSNINTGVGLSLTENPQTQLYEIRAGYIRSQFYSIPTGKNVKALKSADGQSHDTSHLSNTANVSPEVVAGIRMKSGIEHLLLGMEVSESFAVGKTAVASDAATAMYIANAKNPQQAAAAATAISNYERVASQRARHLNDKATDIMNTIFGDNDLPETDALVKAIQGTALEDQRDQIASFNRIEFEQRLRGRWRDLIEEMHLNLNEGE